MATVGEKKVDCPSGAPEGARANARAKVIVLDIETNVFAPPKKQPNRFADVRCLQLAWQVHTIQGELISKQSYLVQPNGWQISKEAQNVHHISLEQAQKEGKPIAEILQEFASVLLDSTCEWKYCVGHGLESLDIPVVCEEFKRLKLVDAHAKLFAIPKYCTMKHGTPIVRLPSKYPNQFTWPRLEVLYKFLFKKPYDQGPLHNATHDVAATAEVFFKLISMATV